MAKKPIEEPETPEQEFEAGPAVEMVVPDPPPPDAPIPVVVKPEPMQFLQMPSSPVATGASAPRRVIQKGSTGPVFVKSRWQHRAAIRQYKLGKVMLGRRSG